MPSIAWVEQRYVATDLEGNLIYTVVHPHTNKAFIWEPEADITVHELAVCLPFLVGSRQDIDVLPDEARRHFTAVTNDPI